MDVLVGNLVNPFTHSSTIFGDGEHHRGESDSTPRNLYPQTMLQETPSGNNRAQTVTSPKTSMSSTLQRASSSGTITPQQHATSQTRHAAPHTSQPARLHRSQPQSLPLAAQRTPSQNQTRNVLRVVPSSNSPPPHAPVAHSVRSADPPALDTSTRIKVRDLRHIQDFASKHMDAFSEKKNRPQQASSDAGPQYEISGMPVTDIIEMVAGLLTKITTTNDIQHEHLHRQIPTPESQANTSPQTSSVLAFHGKNVPSITILNYLTRINRYCPTSYEVFLSLLVYFDRMTERVNSGPMQTLREANQQALEHAGNDSEGSSHSSVSTTPMDDVSASQSVQTATPPPSGSFGKQTQQGGVPGTPHSRPRVSASPSVSAENLYDVDPYNLSHFFVVDSFNIHRLVIAGVTCASKFFSDIFYTNSRYAKVGGLPPPELNHLELQFLLLNDFRLSVPVEEIEAYGTMLVEFYAREVVAQHDTTANESARLRSERSPDSTATRQTTV
ncbi:cyclin-like protein interacting with PHO85 [Elasticomyces elasticus]|nr:cyclin-like protein interacting with PHO85 [Elasticomyces elasticus]